MHDVPVMTCSTSEVWCVIGATRVIRAIFLLDTTNSGRYNGHILATFLKNLSDDETDYEFFQQDGATLPYGV